MEVHGRSWRFMEVHGGSWRFMEVHGVRWMFMEVYGGSWRLLESLENHRHLKSFCKIIQDKNLCELSLKRMC